MEPILITGGAGNLACQLTYELPPEAEILLVDIAPAPVATPRAGCRYQRLDLANADEVTRTIKAFRPRTVLHFGSLLSGSTESNRSNGWEINANAAFRLLEACLENGVGTVLFPSSLAVHGGRIPDPLPEDLAEWPDGLYGVTKLAVERLGTYYHRRHGLDFRCIRLPVIISPFAPAGAASAYASRVFVECAREGCYTFRVTPETRVSTMYVSDALRAFRLFLDADPSRFSRRVYNIHAIAPSAAELAEAARARYPGAKIDFRPDPEVAALIGGWPSIIRDDSARADWGWEPGWELDHLADDIVQRLANSSGLNP